MTTREEEDEQFAAMREEAAAMVLQNEEEDDDDDDVKKKEKRLSSEQQQQQGTRREQAERKKAEAAPTESVSQQTTAVTTTTSTSAATTTTSSSSKPPRSTTLDRNESEEQTLPGAVAIAGIDRRGSSQMFMDIDVDQDVAPGTAIQHLQQQDDGRKGKDNHDDEPVNKDQLIVAELVTSQEFAVVQKEAEENARKQLLSEAVTATVVVKEDDEQQQRRKKQCLFIAIPIAIIVIIAAVAGGVVGSRKAQEAPAPPPPTGDLCNVSIPVSVDEPVQGTLANTTFAVFDYQPLGSTILQSTLPYARWYAMEGDGMAVTMLYCTSPNSLGQPLILEGPCGRLQSFESRFYSMPDSNDCRKLVFRTQLGDTYRIVFQANEPVGDFNFTLYGNDACSRADPIEVFDADDLLVASTVNAKASMVPACETANANNTKGLWYSTVGTGDAMIFGTCRGTKIDTMISVYRGSCEGALECVAGDDDACGTMSWAEWLSVVNETYYIFVSSANEANLGSFSLYTSKRQPYDICEGAMPIQVGGVYNATTKNSTREHGTTQPDGLRDLDCYQTAETTQRGNGIWMTLQGNDEVVTVNPQCTAGMRLTASVFSGPCTDLVCTNSSQRFACESVSWLAQRGEQYYLLFDTQFNTTENVFTFAVT